MVTGTSATVAPPEVAPAPRRGIRPSSFLNIYLGLFVGALAGLAAVLIRRRLRGG
ncbi:hypothetical protein [Cryptosporangium aurantiacum]|uniref:Uncharacterized protein n=1 Tax=Cryptosporangium aurantiacum TaxID=134849 RepID=A0A1M7RG34_9ACTN|nr:hypothetical protein [Cryptosporangium aurantiacum]SHN45099.1 hypothetical protein SAMN05443668_111135 [Cryptosporangium aurantiacum]